MRKNGSSKGNRGAKGDAKGRSTESLPSSPEMGPAAHWKEPGHRKGNKGWAKGSKGKQPTNPREVRVPKTSGKGSPPSSPEPQEMEEACAQEPEPANAHQSAGAEESQPSSKASTPREESAHPSGSCSARSSELLEKQEPEPAEPEEPTERAEPAGPAEPAERAEAAGESKTKTVLTGWAKLFGGPSAADPAPRKGSKGSSKGSKGKQPTNPREVQVPKTSGKGSPTSSPEPEAREEACAQEPEPANAHQSAGAEESQPSSKASTPREESAHPSGSCSARSSELLEKQEPEPAEPEEPTEHAEPAAPAEPAERAEAAGESKTKTVLTGWAKLFGGPSAADPAPRKGINKGTSKGSKGKQPTNPREVQVPKTSGKGSPPSSPEPEAREEACAQEPEPANAHQSAGAEESQPSSKASTPREESAHPNGSCSARSSELLEKQEPEPAEPEEPTERAEPAAPAEPAERAEAAGESKTKTVLTGWAKLFGGPSAADPAPRKGINKGTSKGSKGKQPTNPREVQVPKTSGKGSPPSSPEPEAREEACAQEPEPANAHQSAGAEESQPSSKAASQRDDSPHFSAESSSASSSGPPEPAKEEGPRDQDGTNSAVPLTKAGRFEDSEGSEDLSNKLELDTFDYRTLYLNDIRNRDSDTEPTIYGSDSESSDEGF